MRQALLDATREVLQPIWDQRMEATATEVYTVMVEVMRSAAASDSGQPWWDGKVIEYHRTSRDLALIRLKLNAPMDYHCGQYVHVQVPQSPRNWRYLSLAIPPDPEGYIEFHVKAVPGGLVSGDMVNKTKVGDTWRISPPLGALSVNRDGGDVLMVAGSTGIAPLRCLIMELSQWAENPRVHLFYGARYPQELYDLWTLWHIASTNPWLSVTPVSEYPRNPDWANEYHDPTPPRGLHVRQTGLLSEVVTAYGGWGDRQILLGGSASMIQATKEALVSKGADASRIQHDPL
jgi:NAD(P)H-flavin reductase